MCDTEGMLKFPPLTNRPIVPVQQLLLMCILKLPGYCCLLVVSFSLLPSSLFFRLGSPSRFCSPVRAAHPFFVLPCQPAYVCPVLSAPSLVCRTEGVLKFYSFAQPPECYSVQLLLLPYMLKLHGYCCLLAFFLLLPASFFFTSRICSLTPKTFPCCMIVCVCPVHASHHFVVLPCQPAYVCPRIFGALFRVPHRGYVKVIFTCQTALILHLLCVSKLHGRFLSIFGGHLPTWYRVGLCLVPATLAIALLYDGLCVSLSCPLWACAC